LRFGAPNRPTTEEDALTPETPAHPAPIRVVFCTDNLGIGGTELNAVRTAEHLDPARVRLSVVLLGADGELRPRYEQAAIAVEPFPIDSLYGGSAIRQGRRLARYLADEQVDILHCHDMYSNVFGSLWGRMAGVPGIIVSRRWWNTLPNRKLRLANRLAYRAAHRVLANSDAVARSLSGDEGVRPDRIVVVPNFVEEAAFEAPELAERDRMRRELGIEPGGIVIGIIARLVAVKDHATLLRASALLLERFPELRIVLVGNGPERGALEALARDLGIARQVTFTGTQPNRPNLHHLFDLSVLSSLSEGFPNSVVEAMAAARPVVATRVGGTPDAIEDGKTGLLVPPANAPAMANAIGRILSDPALAARLGTAAQESARRSYSRPAVLGGLLTLYEELARR